MRCKINVEFVFSAIFEGKRNLETAVGLRFGMLELDLTRSEVRLDGRRVELSQREFGLLERLALSPNRVFTAEELVDLVWGEAASQPGVVKVYVHHLRGKLGPNVIRSSRRGYQLGLEAVGRESGLEVG